MPNEGRPIDESGMSFGPYAPERLFYIERASVYRELGQGYRAVEFVYLQQGQSLCFVEAKNSSPRPTSGSRVRFDEFINDIAEKFEDSYQIFLSAFLRRRDASEVGQDILQCDFREIVLRYYLVIHGHEIGWLPPLQEALTRRLVHIGKVWDLKVAVINDEQAKMARLILQ